MKNRAFGELSEDEDFDVLRYWYGRLLDAAQKQDLFTADVIDVIDGLALDEITDRIKTTEL